MGGGLDGVEIKDRVRDRFHGGDQHRQVFGEASGHHGIDGQLFHRGRAPNGRNLGYHVV